MDLARAADARRLDDVARLAAEVARLQARMCALLAACAPGEQGELREELSCLLRVSAYAAEGMLVTGQQLARRLPVTRAALAAGDISYDHARRIATGLAELPDAAAAAAEPELVAAARECTPGRLARLVERAVIAVAPREAHEAAAAAAATREVTTYPLPNGLATVVATLPAPAAQEVMLALDAAADRREPGDTRSRGARRADALHAWARNALTSSELPTRHGRAVTVHVTMSVATALGLADEPADLAGYGPIPAPLARALAVDATWRALVTDAATGRVVRLGGVAYRPGQALRDLVLARHDTCCFPHCGRPASACDLDHRVAWADGGPTHESNLAPLCRRHHRLKTSGTWTPTARGNGEVAWTSPQRRRYVARERVHLERAGPARSPVVVA